MMHVAGEWDASLPSWLHSGIPGQPGWRSGFHNAPGPRCQGQLPDRWQRCHQCRYLTAFSPLTAALIQIAVLFQFLGSSQMMTPRLETPRVSPCPLYLGAKAGCHVGHHVSGYTGTPVVLHADDKCLLPFHCCPLAACLTLLHLPRGNLDVYGTMGRQLPHLRLTPGSATKVFRMWEMNLNLCRRFEITEIWITARICPGYRSSAGRWHHCR